jgi:hypothetical protein
MSAMIMDARELAIAVGWPCQTDKAVSIISSRDVATRAEERERCADRNCAVCEGYYTKTLCGGTKDKPYRPNHCMFRATIMQDKENT